MTRRVVVTGMGIVAPDALNIQEFRAILKEGRSVISHVEDLEEYGFRCTVGGVADLSRYEPEDWYEYFDMPMASNFIKLAAVAGVQAWLQSGLPLPPYDSDSIDWDSGMIIGSGVAGVEVIVNKVGPLTRQKKVKKIGSYAIQNTMLSGAAAHLSAILAIGNQVYSNSSACSTGTESIIEGFYKIKYGQASRMVVGSSEGYSPFTWAPFDAARVLNIQHNDQPREASRPMSASAGGFVPGSGAGVLILEELEAAKERGAPILAEILAGSANSGGQRGGGSMTFPNNEGVVRCIRQTIEQAGIPPEEIDLINGHLTGTKGDYVEVKNWVEALQVSRNDFPMIQAPKSIFGHALAAAGSLESIAVILQLTDGFIHPSLNCKDLQPQIADLIDEDKIPRQNREATDLRTIIKASFGFGDVNTCLIFRKWEE
jgi:3-oxoacyl-(acyl-carrier-protein) synthase